jgi:hypothetical protein
MKYIYLDFIEWCKHIKWLANNTTDERFAELLGGILGLTGLCILALGIVIGIVALLAQIF